MPPRAAATSIRRHLAPVLVLPGVVTVVIPALLSLARTPLLAWGAPSPWNVPVLVAGGALGLLGILLMARTVHLFGSVGRGTLAPWDPPTRLVIRGPYRYVRNPMITGVICILAGETVLLGSPYVLGWLIFFSIAQGTYIPLHEERRLAGRFGADYAAYKRNVPRWVPRLTPWQQPSPNR